MKGRIHFFLILTAMLYLTGVFNILQAEESMLEKYKKQQKQEVDSYKKQVDSELNSYRARVEKERKEWQEYVNNVRAKWGEYTDSTPKAWAEYGAELNSLSVVDFESNKIEIEVLIDENNDQKAEEIMNKRFKKIIQEKDKATKKNLLEDQLKYKKEKVTANNSKKYIREKVKKNLKKEVIVGDDGRARTKYKITLDLVPNSIQIRAKKYMPLVKKYSKKYKIDPALVLAIIHTESAFNTKAFSRRPDGTPMACGLMQLIPTMAARDAHRALYGSDKIVKPEFLYNPDNNIKMGVWYLKWLKKWWKSRELKWYKKNSSDLKIEYYTITSYNQGLGLVRKRAHKPDNLIEKSDEATYRILNTSRSIPKEGRDYLERVVKRKKLYKSL